MRLDIDSLMSFYQTPLGRCARNALLERVSGLWGGLNGLDVLSVGYGPPFLEGLQGKPRRMISLMPAGQGGHAWQANARGSSVALADENRMPFTDAIFDRVLAIHALEETSDLQGLLREIWRVSAPQARIILIVPNRVGLWTRSDATPFGNGRPFSLRQLKRLMKDALIEPTAWTRSLYTPPVDWRIFTSSSEGWERTGELLFANLGGVILVEGIKRVQIDPNLPERARVVVPVRGRPALT